nr:citrate synthase [Quercus suber]
MTAQSASTDDCRDTANSTLTFRGVNITELVEKYEYEDTAFLLIYGYLPNAEERNRFRAAIVSNMNPPSQVLEVVRSFERSAPAFAMIIAALAAWNGAQPEDVPVHIGSNPYMAPSRGYVDRGITKTFGAMAAVVALTGSYKRGLPFNAPNPDASLSYNMLYMSNMVNESGVPDPEHVRTLSKLMILYADHGMSNSTTTFLHVASSLADPITCAISLVTSAYGPLHGGAIEMAYKQFASIGRVENIPAFLDSVKAQEQRLSGYGHRIWKNKDPRFAFVQELIETPSVQSAVEKDPLLVIARAVEQAVLTDSYFTSRGLKQNMDLAGCFIFKALGFEQDMLVGVAMFARFAGVLAHWREQLRRSVSIWRPQSMYVPTEAEALRAENKNNDENIRSRARTGATAKPTAKL